MASRSLSKQALAALGVVLAMVWLGSACAPAQPSSPGAARPLILRPNGPPAAPTTASAPTAAPTPAQPDDAVVNDDAAGTNDMGQIEDFAPGDEPASTNGAPTLTNGAPGDSRPSGRAARERRFRRQRSGQGGGNAYGSGDSASGTNGAPASLDYSAFSIVASRNIFNPSRYARNVDRGPQRPPTEYLTFVGTMSYDKGTFAFFSGTSSKALKLADSIVGFKLTNITPDTVKLSSGTNQIELRVGMQLRREEDGPWVASRNSVTFEPTPAPAAAPATDALPSGPDMDVLKKMAQRRASQE